MMQAMQSQVPQELSALMALQEGMQTGQVAATTPDGSNATIAAKTIGAAQQQMAPQMPPQMPPQMQQGMPGMAKMTQQAGIAAQIQAMQQQKMQEAMMQQAAQATQRPPMTAVGGVAGLNPRVKDFAEGGIVGYQGGGVTLGSAPVTGYAPVYEEARRLGINLSPYDSEEERREKLERVARMKEAAKGFGSAQIPGQAPEVAELAAAMNRRPEPTPLSVQVQASDPRAMMERLLRADIPEAERAAALKELFRQYPGLRYLSSAPQEGGDPLVRQLSAQVPGAAVPPPTAGTTRTSGTIPIPRVGLGSLPAAQRDEMGPPVPAPGERQFAEAFDALRRAKEQAVRPQQVGTEATGMADEERQFIISRGGDPDLLKKAAEDVTRRAGERGGYYTQQAQDVLEKQQRRSLATYLMNARGSRLGETFASAANAANRAEELALAQSQRFMELKFQVQDAAAKDKLLLDKARDETMRGQFDKARKTLEEREKNRQKQGLAEAELKMNYGKFLAGEEDKAQSRLIKEAELAAQQRGQDLQYLGREAAGASKGDTTRLREQAEARRLMQADPAYRGISEALQRAMRSRQGLKPDTDPTRAAEINTRYENAVKEYAALAKRYGLDIGDLPELSGQGGATSGNRVLNWGDI